MGHLSDHPAFAAVGPACVPSLEGRNAVEPFLCTLNQYMTSCMTERTDADLPTVMRVFSQFASPQCGIFEKKNKEDSPDRERLTANA